MTKLPAGPTSKQALANKVTSDDQETLRGTTPRDLSSFQGHERGGTKLASPIGNFRQELDRLPWKSCLETPHGPAVHGRSSQPTGAVREEPPARRRRPAGNPVAHLLGPDLPRLGRQRSPVGRRAQKPRSGFHQVVPSRGSARRASSRRTLDIEAAVLLITGMAMGFLFASKDGALTAPIDEMERRCWQTVRSILAPERKQVTS